MSGIVGQNPGRGSGVVGAVATIADESIDSDAYIDASIDNAHLADNAVGLDEMAGGTDGNIISYDASGDPVAIATGNDGQVLTSAGAGAPPVFEAAAAGGSWTRISASGDGSAASKDFTGLSLASYEAYCFIFNEVSTATDGSDIMMAWSDDDGSTFESGSYYTFMRMVFDEDGADESTNSVNYANGMVIAPTHLNVANRATSGWLLKTNKVSSDGPPCIWHFCMQDSGSDTKVVTGAGNIQVDADSGGWDAFRFLTSGGNIIGQITCYGITDS